MREITQSTVFVSAKGGTLDFVDAFGEVVFSCKVPAGRVSAREYFELVPDAGHLQIADGLVAVQPRDGYGVMSSDQSFDTGANPDYQPTTADAMQRQLRIMSAQIASLVVENKATARRVHLDQLDVVPTASQSDGEASPDVVE